MDLKEIITSGLSQHDVSSTKIAIVGAGMAGLVAGYELKKAGYDVTILEAQNRIGGRVFTVREPFSDGLYGEAGAMRIPTTHKLTMGYIEKFRLETYPFHSTFDNNFLHFNGQRQLIHEVEQNPTSGFKLMTSTGQSAFALWDNALSQFFSKVSQDASYWDVIKAEYGNTAVYDFVFELFGSREVISDFGMVSLMEMGLHDSFMDMLQIIYSIGAELVQIKGGTDCLPQAFYPELKEHIQFGAELTAIDQDETSATLYYQQGDSTCSLTCDYALLTVPFPALRFIDVLKPFSKGKQAAIRQLQYMEISKVLLQFRRRFWEDDDGIYGGRTVTDLPIRTIYYPERDHATAGGVMIGAYIFGSEARRWSMMDNDLAVKQTLKYVNQIHPSAKDDFESGVFKDWGTDRFAGGLATYYPGDHELYDDIIKPEDRIYFAGEHASLYHTWIEGAVESSLRAVSAIHQQVCNDGE